MSGPGAPAAGRLDLDDGVALLLRTPEVLRALVGGLGERLRDAAEGPETFGPREVVAHMVQAERDLWIPRLHTVFERGEGEVFATFDRTAHRAWYGERTVDELLDDFERERRRSLEALGRIDRLAERLDTRGTHPEFGSVTAGQLLATWVVHDLTHVRQICRVVAKQWRDAVGPWASYLTVFREGPPAEG